MSKDHFPVNDKTIADVNKANARAYSGDAENVNSSEARAATGYTAKQRVLAKHQFNMRARQANAQGRLSSGEINPLPNRQAKAAMKKSGDHVRESSQEKGEQQRDGWPRSLRESSMEHFLALTRKGINHASTKQHESELHGFGEEGKKIVASHLTQHQANIKAGLYPDPDKK